MSNTVAELTEIMRADDEYIIYIGRFNGGCRSFLACYFIKPFVMIMYKVVILVIISTARDLLLTGSYGVIAIIISGLTNNST